MKRKEKDRGGEGEWRKGAWIAADTSRDPRKTYERSPGAGFNGRALVNAFRKRSH